nr:peptidoglycan-binding protein [Oscillospiraceae bacterium]
MIHTGLYIGGGEVIHCSVTVKREPLSAGKWTHWARPACLADGWKPEKGETVKRALVKGNRGDDVAELQAGLNQLGYDCGTVDGIFGQKTLAAVKAFQATHELTVDGVAGPKTQAALLAALEEDKDDPGDRFTATLTGLTLAQADAVRRDWPDAVIVLEE